MTLHLRYLLVVSMKDEIFLYILLHCQYSTSNRSKLIIEPNAFRKNDFKLKFLFFIVLGLSSANADENCGQKILQQKIPRGEKQHRMNGFGWPV